MSIIRDGGATKQRVIGLLVSGYTATRIAKIVGIDRNTITKWRKDPKFMAALEAAVERQRNRIEARLAKAADLGIKTLTDEMTAADASKDRISAASTVVNAHIRATGNRIKPKVDPNAGPLLVFPPGTVLGIVAKPPQSAALPPVTATVSEPSALAVATSSLAPSLADLAPPALVPETVAGGETEGEPE